MIKGGHVAAPKNAEYTWVGLEEHKSGNKKNRQKEHDKCSGGAPNGIISLVSTSENQKIPLLWGLGKAYTPEGLPCLQCALKPDS